MGRNLPLESNNTCFVGGFMGTIYLNKALLVLVVSKVITHFEMLNSSKSIFMENGIEEVLMSIFQ